MCYTYFQTLNSVFSNTSMTFVVQNTMTDTTARSLKHTYITIAFTVHTHTLRGLVCLPTLCYWLRTYKYKGTTTNTNKKHVCVCVCANIH